MLSGRPSEILGPLVCEYERYLTGHGGLSRDEVLARARCGEEYRYLSKRMFAIRRTREILRSQLGGEGF